MKTLKSKIAILAFCWIVLFSIVLNPTFGLNLYSTNIQTVASVPETWQTGFIGSSYVTYKVTTLLSNNTIIGYSVEISALSLSSILLLITPIVFFLYFVINDYGLTIQKKKIEV